VLVERCGDGGALELAKGRLAVVDEDVSYRLARHQLHVDVAVPKAHAEAFCQLPADRRLTASGRTDQHDPRAHWTARTPGRASR
jgi:hypothetical protein